MSANSVTKNFNNHIFDKVNNPPGKCYILKLALSEATQKFSSEKVGKSVNLLRRKNPPKRDWTNFRRGVFRQRRAGGSSPPMMRTQMHSSYWPLICKYQNNIFIIFRQCYTTKYKYKYK